MVAQKQGILYFFPDGIMLACRALHLDDQALAAQVRWKSGREKRGDLLGTPACPASFCRLEP